VTEKKQEDEGPKKGENKNDS